MEHCSIVPFSHSWSYIGDRLAIRKRASLAHSCSRYRWRPAATDAPFYSTPCCIDRPPVFCRRMDRQSTQRQHRQPQNRRLRTRLLDWGNDFNPEETKILRSLHSFVQASKIEHAGFRIVERIGEVVNGLLPALQSLSSIKLDEALPLPVITNTVNSKLLESGFAVSMVIIDIFMRIAHLFIYSAVVSSRKALKVSMLN